ncbi:MAG: iron ABC transporter permease [Microbacteriaceae bacterium]|nr:iron ABC transporter permease [Microbacteriaceae bacterium]
MAAAVIISALSSVPLIYVAVTAIVTGWPTLSALIFRNRVGELLVNTAGLVIITVPLTAVVGLAAALLVERTTLPGARVFALLLAAPLAIPAFVHSYGWVTVIPSLHGLGSGVLIGTLAYFPLVYLPCAAALRRLDPALEEAASGLGLRPTAMFLRVIFPQLRLPLLGGSLLIALHLLAEYGAFALIRFDTFTTAIIDQYRSTFNGPAANALASVLVFCCLFVLVTESGARGRARFARVGAGASRPVIRRRLRRSTPAAYGYLVVLVLLSTGVPLITVVRWLTAGGARVWGDGQIVASLAQTLGYGLTGAAITTVLALPVALLAVRYPGRLARILESVGYITSSLPGIVTALALVTVSIRYLQPLYQSSILVAVAYALMFLPRALVSLSAGLAQVPLGLEEAARSLGIHPTVAFIRVTLRFIAPTTLAGGALVFLGVINELTATLLLAPSGTRTLAIQFWSRVNEIDYAGAAPYAMLMIVLSLPVTYLLFSRSRLVETR